MKLNRKQLRRLIEASLFQSFSKGRTSSTIEQMADRLSSSPLAYFWLPNGANAATTLMGQAVGSEAIAAAATSAGLITVSGMAGYALGDYIDNYMSGNTGTADEKFINSFKRHAKDMIGELGVKFFGVELLSMHTWDTLSDKDYFEIAVEKGFKGLKPHEVDKGRRDQLLSMLVVHNAIEGENINNEVQRLFDYRYLDADAWMGLLKKSGKDAEEFSKKIKELIQEMNKVNTAKKPVNESLSRGSLYRRRYYNRY